MGSKRLNWSLLGQIAAFWNGHLSAIAIVCVAMGLYLNSREFLKQRELEEDQTSKQAVTQQKWQLRFLISQLEVAAKKIIGFKIEYTPDGVQRELLVGADAISRSLLERRADTYFEIDQDVFIDPESLHNYSGIIGELQAMANEVNDDALKRLVVKTAENVVDRQIIRYTEDHDRYVNKILDDLQKQGVPDPLFESLKLILKSGWTLNWYETDSWWSATAVRESIDGPMECSVNGHLRAQDALLELERLWLKSYNQGTLIGKEESE